MNVWRNEPQSMKSKLLPGTNRTTFGVKSPSSFALSWSNRYSDVLDSTKVSSHDRRSYFIRKNATRLLTLCNAAGWSQLALYFVLCPVTAHIWFTLSISQSLSLALHSATCSFYFYTSRARLSPTYDYPLCHVFSRTFPRRYLLSQFYPTRKFSVQPARRHDLSVNRERYSRDRSVSGRVSLQMCMQIHIFLNTIKKSKRLMEICFVL